MEAWSGSPSMWTVSSCSLMLFKWSPLESVHKSSRPEVSGLKALAAGHDEPYAGQQHRLSHGDTWLDVKSHALDGSRLSFLGMTMVRGSSEDTGDAE